MRLNWLQLCAIRGAKEAEILRFQPLFCSITFETLTALVKTRIGVVNEKVATYKNWANSLNRLFYRSQIYSRVDNW